MVHHASATFAALADPVRREIVTRLAAGEAPVTALAAPFDMSLQAVRKHLAVLESAGLVSSRKVGRVRLCALRQAPLKDAAQWIQSRIRLWDSRFDALADVVEKRRKK